MARNEISAVDLDIKVSVRTVDGEKVLRYALSSPSGAVPLTHQEVQTEPFKGSFDGFRDRLNARIQAFDEHLDPYGSCLLGKDFEPELRKLGNDLYRQLFPAQMKWMYRQWREKVRTIQISSAEWGIPWELIRPFDHDLEPVIDDDFLGARFQVTRWLIGGTAPAARIRVEKMACVEAGESNGLRLPAAIRERELLADLARRRGIEDCSPSQATIHELMELLLRGGLHLLHFVGHGEFSRENPEDSRIILVDGRSLTAGDLVGPLLTRIANDRPLVYFNACSVAQQGAELTSLSGWPEAWAGRGKAGAFVAPQWEVRDSLSFEFARIFYRALESGRTLGTATRLARFWARRKNRKSATWLAFAVYGHPNARVIFCDEHLPVVGRPAQSHRASLASEVPRARPFIKGAPLNKPAITKIKQTEDLGRLKDPLKGVKDQTRTPEVEYSYESGNTDPTKNKTSVPTSEKERVNEKDGTILVYVPSGEFTIGAEGVDPRSRPVRRVRLSSFWIGKFLVTNEQFSRYLEENPHCPKPALWGDSSFNQPLQPVVGVNWEEAQAYCCWAGLKLPSEAQWEAAARGTDQRPYPWGKELPTNLHASFNGTNGATTPVGNYSAGIGPYGAFDQAGNVWEWCADPWNSQAYKQWEDGQLDPTAKGEPDVRALRGGSWMNPSSNLHAAYRERTTAKLRFKTHGFRCSLHPI
jgi:serine/threonine-protein kinase